MAVSPSELSKNIDPGSLEYGQRQGLTAALGQLGPAAPAGAMPAPPTPQSALGIPSNPLDPLMQGMLPASDNIMAGLGQPQRDPIVDSRVERLRAVALYAKSPVLRYLASRAIPGLLSDLENEF